MSDPTPPPAATPPPGEPGVTPADRTDPGAVGQTRTQAFLRDLFGGSAMVSLCAVPLALLVGAVLIIIADEDVTDTLSYVFARPTDFFAAAWESVSSSYIALFRGSILDFEAEGFVAQIRPLTESLVFATPLIFAGLGVAVAFRAGLFNIGAQGQIIVGAIMATYIGFAFDLPGLLHLLLAVLGGALGGALWGAIPGILKARSGANEVIVTIMLNYVAVNLVGYVLKAEPFNPNGTGQRSPVVAPDALYPTLLGADFRLNWSFVLALVAAVGVWWLMERSTLGFELRAVGANPGASRTAGMSVGKAMAIAMIIAGGLAGLAATSQVLGTERSLTAGVAATIGFDAITVALLGRSRPLGTVLAGLLFGALKAGGFLMQAQEQTPNDIILVIQSIIVLLIAAPPLVRAVFRLPDPARPPKRSRSTRTEVSA